MTRDFMIPGVKNSNKQHKKKIDVAEKLTPKNKKGGLRGKNAERQEAFRLKVKSVKRISR